LWRHHRLADGTCVWSWKLCGIYRALTIARMYYSIKYIRNGTQSALPAVLKMETGDFQFSVLLQIR
jgi:hypothetical protein